ncbi:MAG: Minf_1886 family protein [Opitutaceae bacterium]
MQDPDFAEIVGLICKEDGRFDRKAYDFIRLGLDHAVKELKKKDTTRVSRSRHVSGPELLEGIRVYALDQFGPLAKTVLNSWGVKRCSDFGDIVFNLIEYNVFSKTDNDRREDFSDIYTFDEAFVKPFLPARSRKSAAGASGAEALGSA